MPKVQVSFCRRGSARCGILVLDSPFKEATVSAAAIWFLAGIVLLAIELASPVFVMFFFGLGAWAAGLTALFLHDLALEVVVFGASSVLFLFSLRRLLVRTFRGRAELSSRAASSGLPNRHTGKTGTVTRPIPVNGVGEIAMGGSFWRAVSPVALVEGTPVRVLGHRPDDELTLEVVACGDEPEKNLSQPESEKVHHA